MKLPFFLARRFVAAETLEGTLPVIRDLNAKGLHVAVDMLGEHVEDRDVARSSCESYIGLVHEIAGSGGQQRLDTNISIKLSMIGQLIDEDFCIDNLRRLLEVARRNDVFVRLDMEGSDTTASTLRIFESVYPDYPDHVGPVLQAMLKRTEQDIERMCELNARVRLCKGAYREPPELAHQDMGTIREHFTTYMKRLLTDARYPGIATHDDRLIEATQSFAAQTGVRRDSFEFQMLYGIRPATQEALARDGYHMRVYVPYGTEWFPYFSRRLRERKENVWFILRNLVRR